MDRLPSVIVFDEIFLFFDVSDFYNLSLVCKSFHSHVSLLTNNCDFNHNKKLLDSCHARKIDWYGKKISMIPNIYLQSIKSSHIYLLLQDIYQNTNHLDKLGIHVPYRAEIEAHLNNYTRKNTNHHTNNEIMKHIREEMEFIHSGAISKLRLLKKIKKPFYNKIK